MIADAEMLAAVDAVEKIALLEGNARERRHALLGIADLRHGEFQVFMTTHRTGATRIDNVVGPEHGSHVAGTKGRKLVEDAHELGRDVAELDL